MRNFMRDDCLHARGDAKANAGRIVTAGGRIGIGLPLIEQIVRKDDRARVLHSSETRGPDNQSQLFIWIRRYRLTEEGERRSPWRKAFRRVFPIALRHEILKR